MHPNHGANSERRLFISSVVCSVVRACIYNKKRNPGFKSFLRPSCHFSWKSLAVFLLCGCCSRGENPPWAIHLQARREAPAAAPPSSIVYVLHSSSAVGFLKIMEIPEVCTWKSYCYYFYYQACHPTMCSMSFHVDPSKHSWKKKSPYTKEVYTPSLSTSYLCLLLLGFVYAIIYYQYASHPMCSMSFNVDHSKHPRNKIPGKHRKPILVFSHRVVQ